VQQPSLVQCLCRGLTRLARQRRAVAAGRAGGSVQGLTPRCLPLPRVDEPAPCRVGEVWAGRSGPPPVPMLRRCCPVHFATDTAVSTPSNLSCTVQRRSAVSNPVVGRRRHALIVWAGRVSASPSTVRTDQLTPGHPDRPAANRVPTSLLSPPGSGGPSRTSSGRSLPGAVNEQVGRAGVRRGRPTVAP
jgi:hypothetical protein